MVIAEAILLTSSCSVRESCPLLLLLTLMEGEVVKRDVGDGGSIKIEAGVMGRVERERWSRGWMGKKNEKDKKRDF